MHLLITTGMATIMGTCTMDSTHLHLPFITEDIMKYIMEDITVIMKCIMEDIMVVGIMGDIMEDIMGIID
jgi:hypothetical protein